MPTPVIKGYSIFTLLAAVLALLFIVQAIMLWTGLATGGSVANSNWQQNSNNDYSAKSITQRPLFGQVSGGSNRGNYNTPALQSDFVLQGVFMAPDPARSTAIIASANNQARTYRVDDSLSDSLSIESIEKDHVVVNHNGQLESIRFPTPEMTAALGQSTADLNADDYSQLLSSLSENDQEQLIKNVKAGDLRGLMKALPDDKKLEIVHERLDQLRNQSSKNR